MAVHKRYYEDGELYSKLETRIINYDSITVVIETLFKYLNDGTTEYSVEKEFYYINDKLIKKIETKKTEKLDEQSIIVFFQNGHIKSRISIQRTPFEYNKEEILYNNDNTLSERTTLTQETNPVYLNKEIQNSNYLEPKGKIKKSIYRRNIYKDNHLMIHYGKDEANGKEKSILESYTEYNKNNEITFIEKKELKRRRLFDNQYVEDISITNTNGLECKYVIYEERKGKTKERLILENEEMEIIEKGNHYTYITVKKNNETWRKYQETIYYEDKLKHIEERDVLYNPYGEIIVIRKKYRKIYFDDTDVISMIVEKEAEQRDEHITQINTVKEFGPTIGDYLEQITTFQFEKGKMISCQVENYFDTEHLLGNMEMTKEITDKIFNIKELHTTRKNIILGIPQNPIEPNTPFIQKYIEQKNNRKHFYKFHKEFLADIFKEIHDFITSEEHEWIVQQEIEQMEEEIIDDVIDDDLDNNTENNEVEIIEE